MSFPTTIGPYRILSRLGKGGSSEVFIAQGPWIDKVAVKWQRAAQKRSRFLQEIDIINRFSHKHLSRSICFGIDKEGWAYIVMELIEGKSAYRYANGISESDKLKQVLNICISICKTLQVFHDSGWIHGDLKSKNILVKSNLTPILIDFELTRALSKTGAGKFFGTRSYAPPEQHKGLPLSYSVDIYALTVIMCRMLTKEHPFSKELPPADRFKNLVLPQNIPSKLKSIITNALSNDPTLRPQNGQDFGQMLTEVLDDLNNINPVQPSIVEENKLYWPTSEDLTLQDTFEGLEGYSLNSPNNILTAFFLTGGDKNLLERFSAHRHQNQDWFPEKAQFTWRRNIRSLSVKQRKTLVLLALVGTTLSPQIIAQQVGYTRIELQKDLRFMAQWITVSDKGYTLRFGAVNNYLLQSVSEEEQKKLLDSPQIERTPWGRIAQRIHAWDLENAALEYWQWLASAPATILHWYFLHRLIGVGAFTAGAREIIIARLLGDWKTVHQIRSKLPFEKLSHSQPILSMYLEELSERSSMLLENYDMAILGGPHRLQSLRKHCRSEDLDVQVGSRALISEYNLCQGRFQSAFLILRPLSLHDDPYMLKVFLRQETLLFSHLGQQASALNSLLKLEKLSCTEQELNLIEHQKEHPIWENTLPLRELESKTPYLKAWNALREHVEKGGNRRKIDRLIEGIITQNIPSNLSLSDRSSLLVNKLWRPYERALALPPSPTKSEIEEQKKSANKKEQHIKNR